MVLDENDIQTINEIVEEKMEQHIGNMMEEIFRRLRHLHRDTENTYRKLEIVEHKIAGLAYIMEDGFKGELDEKTIDYAVNLDSECYSDLDSLYSPIDDEDKKDWDRYMMRKRRERMERTERTERLGGLCYEE